VRDRAWLEAWLAAHAGAAGTVHRRGAVDLELSGAVNIPPPVLEIVARIPKGKGMAGLAWARREPVQTCNLKTDATGDVRPGARAVPAEAAVALPVYDDQGALRAVVGIAFAGERVLSPAEIEALAASAAALPGS
jgi:L-methionine (R)-S-oxide reductase